MVISNCLIISCITMFIFNTYFHAMSSTRRCPYCCHRHVVALSFSKVERYTTSSSAQCLGPRTSASHRVHLPGNRSPQRQTPMLDKEDTFVICQVSYVIKETEPISAHFQAPNHDFVLSHYKLTSHEVSNVDR